MNIFPLQLQITFHLQHEAFLVLSIVIHDLLVWISMKIKHTITKQRQVKTTRKKILISISISNSDNPYTQNARQSQSKTNQFPVFLKWLSGVLIHFLAHNIGKPQLLFIYLHAYSYEWTSIVKWLLPFLRRKEKISINL